MKILLVTAELTPLVPVGGIAEYMLGLASALTRKGHDVRVALPLYDYLLSPEGAAEIPKEINNRLVVRLGVGASDVAAVYETPVPCPGDDALSLPVYLFGAHKHFATVKEETGVYADWPNHEPWIAFSRAVVDFLESSDWKPDVVHCHDAHAAMVPVYIKHLRDTDPEGFAASIRTVLTIHNLLAQGKGDKAMVAHAGLPESMFNMDCFEFHGHANCLKAALVSADTVNTVSQTYAAEICETSDFGFGLEGVLRQLKARGKLSGITNGIDEERWQLPGVTYDGNCTIKAIDKPKEQARAPFLKDWGWESQGAPIVGFRGRYDMQKGIDTLVDALPQVLEFARVVIVTWGKSDSTPQRLKATWETLRRLADERADCLRVNPGVLNVLDGTAAHYAMSDFLIVPSRYEPCGLIQMECQRMGTIPIVRHTGGLADTVSEASNGFVYDELDDPDVLTAAVRRAVDAFADPKRRAQLIHNALIQHNGWHTRVEQYEALYRRPTAP